MHTVRTAGVPVQRTGIPIRSALVAATAAVALALGVGAVAVVARSPADAPPAGPGTVPVGAPPPRPAAAAAAPAVPARLLLPDLGVNAPVESVGVGADGQLGVPVDPAVVGWWPDGAAPGSGRGTVVIDGHVNTRAGGPGALSRLHVLRPGAGATVLTDAGAVRYVVQVVRSYPKETLPAEVFDSAGPPRLVLITCGGAFDRHTRQYADNVVAYATPEPPARASTPG
ncbi:class F sortase [Pseudonocardia sp. H11422]|uniref:class F sortase n=1 Tax=Pseudonocardia sp. H11422 TaxID=2835866 RepID=UPI001BDBBC78|nr:class F sortase [Pseudonocardia sp. H11422]